MALGSATAREHGGWGKSLSIRPACFAEAPPPLPRKREREHTSVAVNSAQSHSALNGFGGLFRGPGNALWPALAFVLQRLPHRREFLRRSLVGAGEAQIEA